MTDIKQWEKETREFLVKIGQVDETPKPAETKAEEK